MKYLIALTGFIFFAFLLKAKFVHRPIENDNESVVVRSDDSVKPGSSPQDAPSFSQLEDSILITADKTEKNRMHIGDSVERVEGFNQENSNLPIVTVPTPKTPEQLALEKLKLPIVQELKSAKKFNVWSPSELRFTGIFQGMVSYKGQKYLIRMNLIFHGSTSAVSESTCIVMYRSQKPVFHENYGNGKIQFMRTNEEKYILISVLDQFYFQIFQTMFGNKKSFRTHLTVSGEKNPLVFNLVGMPLSDSLNECQIIFGEEL